MTIGEVGKCNSASRNLSSRHNIPSISGIQSVRSALNKTVHSISSRDPWAEELPGDTEETSISAHEWDLDREEP